MRHRTITIALCAMALVMAACGGGGTTVEDGGEVVIELSEFAFSPDSITVTAGSTVTFVLRNEGEKEHEFMIGRDVRITDGAPDGFEHDFFEGMEPTVVPADAAMTDMDMDMGDGDMGDGDMSEDGDMGDMGDEHAEHGFMVMRSPGQEATITITIPEDATGEWQFGCFEEDGAHWDDGMRGTLTVES